MPRLKGVIRKYCSRRLADEKNRNPSLFRNKQVALVALGLDEIMVGADFIEFFADTSHNDLQRFLPLVDGGLPYRIVNLIRGKNFTGMFCKKIQHVKLIGRKIHRARVVACAAGGREDGK